MFVNDQRTSAETLPEHLNLKGCSNQDCLSSRTPLRCLKTFRASSVCFGEQCQRR